MSADAAATTTLVSGLTAATAFVTGNGTFSLNDAALALGGNLMTNGCWTRVY